MDAAGVPLRNANGRVTARVSPNVGMKRKCLPAPPGHEHDEVLGRRRHRYAGLRGRSPGVLPQEMSGVLQAESPDVDTGMFKKPGSDVLLGEAFSRHRGGMLGTKDDNRLTTSGRVVAADDGHGLRDRR